MKILHIAKSLKTECEYDCMKCIVRGEPPDRIVHIDNMTYAIWKDTDRKIVLVFNPGHEDTEFVHERLKKTIHEFLKNIRIWEVYFSLEYLVGNREIELTELIS